MRSWMDASDQIRFEKLGEEAAELAGVPRVKIWHSLWIARVTFWKEDFVCDVAVRLGYCTATRRTELASAISCGVLQFALVMTAPLVGNEAT